MKFNKKLLLTFCQIFVSAAALPLGIWCCGVFHYLIFSEKIFLTCVVALLTLALWISGIFFRRAAFLLFLAQLGVLAYFFSITPAHRFKDVKWQTSWARRPRAEIAGEKIVFRNVRDFKYRSETDYDVRYGDMTISMDELQSVDLALSHWDGLETVAHTMLCFNFANSKRLVLSMETRIPEGQEQNALAGLFKQYEIIPVLGTPEDLFDLRIKYRGEDFYLYRTNTTPEQMRKLLLFIACYVNSKPEFYNTLTHNCTTSLLPLVNVLELAPIDDFRLLVNGFSDQLMFRLGYLKHRKGESFASLKCRSYIPGKSAGIKE